ncbi:hypothetical protein ACIP6P_12625 [Streptomyces sp. NPDC088729]|uniref:hypothetical protein n=1 Tax=Streptomyces sp. NPDC088729 TaxID=3365876 RepID=UPI0037F6D807
MSARTSRQRLATSVLAVLLAVGTAACSGEAPDKPAADAPAAGDTAGGTGGGDSTPDSGQDPGVVYAACMRDNGVEVDDPKPGERPQIPEGTPPRVMDKLEKVCGELPGSGAMTGGLSSDVLKSPEVEALRLTYLTCMRKNGYEQPEPDANGNVSMQITPEYTAAQKACTSENDALSKKIKELAKQGGAQ